MITNLNETPKAILEANEGDKFEIQGSVYELFKTSSSLPQFDDEFYLCKPMPDHLKTELDDVFYFRNPKNAHASMTKE